MESLSGINNLQRLRELEFNGDLILDEVKEEIKKHKNKPYILHNRRKIQEQTTENTNEEKKSGVRYL
jgi:type III secretory pathway component EscU